MRGEVVVVETIAGQHQSAKEVVSLGSVADETGMEVRVVVGPESFGIDGHSFTVGAVSFQGVVRVGESYESALLRCKLVARATFQADFAIQLRDHRRRVRELEGA